MSKCILTHKLTKMPYNHIPRGRKGIGQNIITLHDKILATLGTEETNMNIIKEITARSQ